jgi:hypothetical protein
MFFKIFAAVHFKFPFVFYERFVTKRKGLLASLNIKGTIGSRQHNSLL